VAGKTIAKLVFLPTETCVNGQTRSFTPTGDLTLAATFTDKTTGLIKVIGGVPQLTIFSGTIDGSTGATFASFGNPAINATDDTAFQAILSGTGVTSTNNSGIWGDNAQSVRQLIARTGDTAPGTTATFTGFSDPVFNTHEAVAFRGTLKVATGQATSSSNEGIWSSDTGQLSLVVQKAGSAPGCPTGASFSGFTELVLPDQGGVVFLAQLSTSTPAAVTDKNNVGIWAVDSNHELQLLVRTGDVIGGKTITKLAFLPALNYVSGQNRSFDQTDGEIAYLATFSDNTTEIFEINSR
jgi:hypothetical protein